MTKMKRKSLFLLCIVCTVLSFSVLLGLCNRSSVTDEVGAQMPTVDLIVQPMDLKGDDMVLWKEVVVESMRLTLSHRQDALKWATPQDAAAWAVEAADEIVKAHRARDWYNQ